MKKIIDEIKRIYELIGDLEAEKNFFCDKCGHSILKGDRYFVTRLKEVKAGFILSEKDIMTLCPFCARTYKVRQ